MDLDLVSALRVLLADADTADRADVAEALRAQGDHVHIDEVSDGPEAWAKLRHTRYDLAVLELRLPRLNALELLRLTRTLDSQPVTVVVFDTPSPALEGMAYRLGATYCDRKPVEIDRLIRILNQEAVARRG